MGQHNHKKPDQRGRNTGSGQFAMLPNDILESNAYRALSPNDRSLLVEMIMLFKGSNNGELYLSVRDAADRMGVADLKSASASFQNLMDLGFITVTTEAAWASRGQGGRARCWRLTWHHTPSLRMGPTMDYRRSEPAPKTRAHARMDKGLRALKRWKQNRSSVEESSTRLPDSVGESLTNALRGNGNTPLSVEDSTTPKMATPLVSTSFHDGGILHTYITPCGGSARIDDQQQQGETRRAPAAGGMSEQDLGELRSRLLAYLDAAGVGAQSGIAHRAKVPGGTLSKFKDGRSIGRAHFIALQLELRRLDADRKRAA